MIINQFWLKLAAWTVVKTWTQVTLCFRSTRSTQSKLAFAVRFGGKVSELMWSQLVPHLLNLCCCSVPRPSAQALQRKEGSWKLIVSAWLSPVKLFRELSASLSLGAVLVQTFNPLHLSAISKGFVLNPIDSNKPKQDFGDLFLVFLPPHFALLL